VPTPATRAASSIFLKDIMKATDCVRGFLSGMIGKKMGLNG
jgi:hypothetical protein